MGIAALITWLLTAVGGFVLLGTWIAKGGLRAPRSSHFPPAVILGHFALAAVGLVLWIIYLIAGGKGLAVTALIVLVPVALLGFVMLFRWLPTYRAARAAPVGGPGTTEAVPAERHFPVPVVIVHGLLAVTTVVLVLLTVISGK